MFSKVLTYAGLASSATAHIILSFPPSYPLQGGVLNAPIMGGSGAPFPCGTNSFGGVQATTFEAGSTQDLKFKGSVVHGGGSCQISVTTDMNPTASSVFKVIKSFEGGCPHRSAPGNIEPGDAELMLPEGYGVQIPDIPAGQYNLAWSWFNKVGNREMYMNCAPIEVTGGSGSVALDSLPNMMVANVPGFDCATIEGTDVVFPDAGAAVERPGANFAEGAPTGAGCGSTGGSVAPPTAPTTPDAPVIENPVAPVAPVAPVTPVAPAPASGACTEGTFNCIDGATYSQCAGGAWTVAMPVAPGTSCAVGQATTLNLQ